jgi:hypothetical protein
MAQLDIFDILEEEPKGSRKTSGKAKKEAPTFEVHFYEGHVRQRTA